MTCEFVDMYSIVESYKIHGTMYLQSYGINTHTVTDINTYNLNAISIRAHNGQMYNKYMVFKWLTDCLVL